MSAAGKLLVCATPIGNLKDVTLRVLEALRAVDVVAAEDTRQTRKLMTHYDISTPLVSYHARNEKARVPQLLARLVGGESVALVSDAGTPGIADPGHRLIVDCIGRGITVDVLPGANAALTALVASGLPTEAFTYVGFLPRRSGPRKRLFEKLVAAGNTFVCYESPHRIAVSLSELAEVSPDSRVAVARELTKLHQEVVRDDARRTAEKVAGKEPKGEYVIVVAPHRPIPAAEHDDVRLAERVFALESEGLDRKEAMRRVSRELHVNRRRVYDAVLEARREASSPAAD